VDFLSAYRKKFMNDRKYTREYAKRDERRDERRPDARDKRSITEELVSIDRQLTRLLGKRCYLLSKAANARKRKGRALADPGQERRMRSAWDELVKREGLDAATTRKLFNLANGLAYNSVRNENSNKSRTFKLFPKCESLDVSIDGPRDLEETRMWAAVAAAAEAKTELHPIVLNDALADLLKALNKGGASLIFEKGKVINAGKAPDFHEQKIYVGNETLNLYLCMAMVLGQPGISTFTGGASLKVMDLRAVAHVFAGLGVRLASLEPQSAGVPVRMESGGMTSARFSVPEGFPAEAAAALALFGPTYPDGIAFTWDESWDDEGLLRRVAALLKECGVPCELKKDSFSVRPARYAVPKNPAISLDPMLCASVLAVPYAAEGKVVLKGRWPAKRRIAGEIESFLKSLGCTVNVSKEDITVELNARPEALDFELEHCSELVPLALAASLVAKSGGRIAIAEDFDSATAMDLGDRLGRFVRVKPGRLVVTGSDRGSSWVESEESWVSPTADWTLALALVSFVAPGILLANPGDLASVWPDFWQLFVNGFVPQPDKKEPEESGKKGRRVRIG